MVEFRLKILAVKNCDDLSRRDAIIFLDENFLDSGGDFAADFDTFTRLNGARRGNGFGQIGAHDFRRGVGFDGLGDDFICVELVADCRADYESRDD